MICVRKILALFIIFMMLVPFVCAGDTKHVGDEKVVSEKPTTEKVTDKTKEKTTEITSKDKSITGKITVTDNDISKYKVEKKSSTEISISKEEAKGEHTKAKVSFPKSELQKIDIDGDGKFGLLHISDNGEVTHTTATEDELVTGKEMIFSTNVINGYSGHEQYTFSNVQSGQILNIDDVSGNYTITAAVDGVVPTYYSIFDNITRNESLLGKAAPYQSIPTPSTANWGRNVVGAYREFIQDGNNNRIRQGGNITHLELNITNVDRMDEFYYTVWRKNGTKYDRIYKTENLISLLSTGYNYIELPSELTVSEGDYYGYALNSTSTSYQLYVDTSVTTGHSKYLDGGVSNPIAYNWASSYSGQTSYTYVIHPHFKHPVFVSIGDSITAGHPLHYSYIETTSSADAQTTTYSYQLSQLLNFTDNSYQNMGIGSQTTTQIKNRYVADVVNLHPDIVIIEGGVNDVAGGATNETILSNIEYMLSAANNNSIHPVLIGILPWTNGNEAQHLKIDYLNSQYESLATEYDATYVDASSYVGVDRDGYYTGNLWNINTAYNAGDGVHFNEAGHAKIAQAIVDEICHGVMFIPNPSENITGYNVASGVEKVLNTDATCTGIEYVDTTGGTHDVTVTVYFTEDITVISDSHTATMQTVNISHTSSNTAQDGELIPYDILDEYFGTIDFDTTNPNATITRNATDFMVDTGYITANTTHYYNVSIPNYVEEMVWSDWDPTNETCNAKLQIGNSTPYTTWNITTYNVTNGSLYKLVYASNGTEVGNATAVNGSASIIIVGLADGVYWLTETSVLTGFVNVPAVAVVIIGAAGAFVGGSFINKWYRRRRGS